MTRQKMEDTCKLSLLSPPDLHVKDGRGEEGRRWGKGVRAPSVRVRPRPSLPSSSILTAHSP